MYDFIILFQIQILAEQSRCYRNISVCTRIPCLPKVIERGNYMLHAPALFCIHIRISNLAIVSPVPECFWNVRNIYVKRKKQRHVRDQNIYIYIYIGLSIRGVLVLLLIVIIIIMILENSGDSSRSSGSSSSSSNNHSSSRLACHISSQLSISRHRVSNLILLLIIIIVIMILENSGD